METRQVTTLRKLLWKFLGKLALGLMVVIVIPVFLFLIAVNAGIISYANTAEKRAKELAETLSVVENVDEILRKQSASIRYAKLSNDYRILMTSMTEREQMRSVEAARNGIGNYTTNERYLVVKRDTEIVVIRYDIGSGYSNLWMQRHFPKPEWLLMLVITLNSILSTVYLMHRFVKKISMQLRVILDATREVAGQNLDFEVGHSNVKEFEEILNSFSDMKNNLKHSLQEQWRVQREQKEQLAALAHDLKTPLTVVQGNLDLLEESVHGTEELEEIRQASQAAERMTTYIQLLIEISKMNLEHDYHFETVQIKSFLDNICAQAETIAYERQVQWKKNCFIDNQEIYGVPILLERAFLNVINNAMEHSDKGGSVWLDSQIKEDYLQIVVCDNGQGFDDEVILHGKELFYMKDSSRTSQEQGMHFGMGLYIANTLINRHGGQLLLENQEDRTGAKVTIEIPVKK